MPLCRKKIFTTVLVLIGAVISNASPAATTYGTVISAAQQPADISAVVACYNKDIKPICSDLADIGRKLRTPPASSTKSDKAASAESLPAVPQTLLMALTGFICVSLVKDRRVWLTVLCGLLWAGQTGIQVLPQLAEHFNNANHSKQRKYENPAYSFSLENSLRRRCDIEGSRYISLLHYLDGIPETGIASSAQLITSSHSGQRPFGTIISHLNRTSPFAILPEQYGFSLISKCLTSAAGHSSVFSAGFIFENLARGPPQSASMSFQTVRV